ncbi:MAG: DUF3179 domain-containing protein [Gammaproteobacteria bacterium]|nr:DUF3179 domain-containing protein [Gammaproteobacteria bacterium]NIR84089.1 DUF3179 domain-containing protein [Gammaproteobacteria bacterium]NIR89233.1 DUF3179 domain-containing protein [Gammaproteobacteria bacterium]NIU05035.1 DUF3179 domain-containing protein [Gammaproteobacteria bacterium]NIV52201.1 DUF3179 domain-containing protein [Gammaproteobacteria bacterium]
MFSTAAWPKTNFDKTLVDLDEIISGGPPKDGIPAIDDPNFVSAEQAGVWLDAREPVIAVTLNGDARAYPLQILIYHEIVNDRIGGVPVSVTFCPLCNACIVFDRRVDQRVLDFGTTGKLRKSDLVMYDRQTESWWQQFSGRAIVGDLAGTELERIPASIVAFESFERAHPDGRVLSRDTGHRRPYGRNPYRGYDSIDDQPFLFMDPVDPRLPPMERVLNITVDDQHRLYPFSLFAEQPVINDEVGGVPVVVMSRRGTLSVLDDGNIRKSRTVPSATAYERRLDGRVLTFERRDGSIVDRDTGSEWDLFGNAVAGPLKGRRLTPTQSGLHFAFAWLAFNPDSEIYGRE